MISPSYPLTLRLIAGADTLGSGGHSPGDSSPPFDTWTDFMFECCSDKQYLGYVCAWWTR